MALEALNHAGASKTNLIVILNDNEMSISKNVGGISMMLSKLRTKSVYVNSSLKGKKIIGRIPLVGKKVVKLVQRIWKNHAGFMCFRKKNHGGGVEKIFGTK